MNWSNHHPERAGLSFIVLLPAIYLFFLSDPPWEAPEAATAYYSVLAFLCVTMAVSAMNRIRLDPSPSNNMMFSATFYASIIFSAAAIFYVLSDESPAIHTQTSGIFLNLVALTCAGVMMLLYSRLDEVIKKEDSLWFRRSTPILIVAVSIIVFVAAMVVVRMPIAESIFLVEGYAVGIVAIICYIVAAILTLRQTGTANTNDKTRLSIAFILFAAAALNHMLILPNPTSQWVISIALMGLGFVIANVAISYTFLKEIGIGNEAAYTFAIATSVMVILPFILSHLIDAFANLAAVADIGATIVIHFGGAALAGLSAYSLYSKTKGQSYPGSSFIVFMLLFWMVSEIGLVASHLLPAYGLESESLVPYVCGIIITSVTLVIAVRHVYNPTSRRINPTNRLHLLALILAPCFLILGEYARSVVLQVPGFPEGIVVPAIMLAMSYISLYALLTYILLEAGSSGGQLTFGTIGAGLVSVWIIIVILKANFEYGSLGWWAAELFMLSATTVFSILLLRLYLVESEKADTFIPRAARFSSLMSDAIVARQTRAIDRLTQLTLESEVDEDRLDSISSVLSELSHANEHAKHLEEVIAGERFRANDLETMDLAESFALALKTSNIPETVRWSKEEERESHKCFVRANGLLTDLFTNLFQGITRRIGIIEFAEIDIAPDEDEPESHCRVILDMIAKVEDIDEALGLMKRYAAHSSPDVIELVYVKRLVDLYGGTMKWKLEIASQETLFINATISFPQAVREENVATRG